MRQPRQLPTALTLLAVVASGSCIWNDDAPPPTPARADGGAAVSDGGTPTGAVLPVVILDVPNMTPGMFKLFGAKVTGTIRIIEDHDGHFKELKDLDKRPSAVQGPMGISLRGNSSTNYPLVTWADNATGFLQRSYSIELRDKMGNEAAAPVLGMPSDGDWALIGCWNDKTCMRNALPYQMGQDFGRWSPRLRFVEVFFNGDYIGIYQLVEPARRSKDRIDVPKVADDPSTGDVTGGYIFRREGPGKKSATAMGVAFDWISPTIAPGLYPNQQVYTYHYPGEDVITPAQKTYLQSYVAGFEEMMKGADWNNAMTGYPAKIDVTSWIDYALMNELTQNVDAYFKSVYYVKEPDSKGGRLRLDPLWDYNMGFGNADYREGWKTNVLNVTAALAYGGECDYQGRFTKAPPICDVGCCTAMCDKTKQRCWNLPVLPFYWEKLWKDPAFLNQLQCRWRDLRKGPLSMSFVDARLKEWHDQLAPLAVPRHLQRWPELLKTVWANPYTVDPTSAPIKGETNAQFFDREVTWLRNWVQARVNFLDASLPGTCDHL
jgi:hypothetical protein